MRSPKILAIKLRALGDTVLLAASLQELRTQFPSSEIHVLVPSLWAPLLQNHPSVDRIWTLDRSLKGLKKLGSLLKLIFQLRKENFAVALGFHASFTSAFLAKASGAKIRSIHFHSHSSKNVYSSVVVPGKGMVKPILERDLDTVRGLGIPIGSVQIPQVFLSAIEIQEASGLFQSLKLKSPVLGINLGASRPTKLWPIDSFAQLAKEWTLTTSGSFLPFAGPGEEHLLRDFCKKAEIPYFNPQFSIRSLAAALSQLSILVGGDSGPKHLAIAVGTPTVTLFGPEDPFEWHPYLLEKNPYLFIETLNCRKDADPGYPSWCGLRKCVVEKHRCMTEIRVDSVLAKCQKVLKQKDFKSS